MRKAPRSTGRRRLAALAVCAGLAACPGALHASDAGVGAPGLVAGKSALDQKDYARAYGSLRPLAEAGDSEAQRLLGTMYRDGSGVTKDEAAAASWFGKAAGGGSVQAQATMGALYLAGRGVVKDAATANRWFQEAAESGNAFAQRQLGYSYLAGRGIAKDPYTGLDWLARAAVQGNVQAMRNIADAYLSGEGLEKNAGKAVFWYSVALRRANSIQRYLWLMPFRDASATLSTEDVAQRQRDAMNWSPAKDGAGSVMADAMAFRDGHAPAKPDGL